MKTLTTGYVVQARWNEEEEARRQCGFFDVTNSGGLNGGSMIATSEDAQLRMEEWVGQLGKDRALISAVRIVHRRIGDSVVHEREVVA